MFIREIKEGESSDMVSNKKTKILHYVRAQSECCIRKNSNHDVSLEKTHVVNFTLIHYCKAFDFGTAHYFEDAGVYPVIVTPACIGSHHTIDGLRYDAIQYTGDAARMALLTSFHVSSASCPVCSVRNVC